MKGSYEYTDYTVIIGDIIDSKKITNREQIQAQFKKMLDEINQQYAEDIASKFTITLGDEFQGLLKNRNNVVKIITDIEMALAPIRLRFGVGIGEVSTAIDFEATTEIDGPAYHRARAMIDELAVSERQYSKRQANILIASEDSNQEIDQLLNAILSVCTALKSKWTVRQWEVVEAYLQNEENQYQAAEQLGIGQSSVSKALNAAEFVTYHSAMETVSAFLTEEGED